MGAMGMQNINSWLSLVSDSNVLSVLFYLEKYNPDVTINDLERDLNLDKKKVTEILSNLTREHVIEVSDKHFVELTENGRISVERLMAIV